MGELVPWLLGAAPGAMIGYQVGAWRHQRRLEAVARNMPRDSIALATIERLERESRRGSLLRDGAS